MGIKISCFLIIFILVPFSSFGVSIQTENNFLVIGDVHLDKSTTSHMEITPFKKNSLNDLDEQTFKQEIKTIYQAIHTKVIARPKFIILLGDLVGHLRYSKTSAMDSEATVFSTLKDSFPNIPIMYIFGNNDSLAADYGPFVDKGRHKIISAYEVAKKKAGWANGFLSTGQFCKDKRAVFPCIITEDPIKGTYSAYLSQGLRLISLNTVPFSPKRTQDARVDALNQLNSLKEQLEEASKNKESVLIAMHIPPGNTVYSSLWLAEYQTEFLNNIKNYQKIIMGLLAGHTHAEEIKIIQDRTKNFINAFYLTGALSTSHGNSPSVKTFYFSQINEKWVLSNYETFHFTILNNSMSLNKLFDYNSYYCSNPENDNIQKCLVNVNEDKMKLYFTAGNKNFYLNRLQSMFDKINNKILNSTKKMTNSLLSIL